MERTKRRQASSLSVRVKNKEMSLQVQIYVVYRWTYFGQEKDFGVCLKLLWDAGGSRGTVAVL